MVQSCTKRILGYKGFPAILKLVKERVGIISHAMATSCTPMCVTVSCDLTHVECIQMIWLILVLGVTEIGKMVLFVQVITRSSKVDA